MAKTSFSWTMRYFASPEQICKMHFFNTIINFEYCDITEDGSCYGALLVFLKQVANILTRVHK